MSTLLATLMLSAHGAPPPTPDLETMGQYDPGVHTAMITYGTG